MAQVTITDGMSALNVRTNINSMFTELYTLGTIAEKLSRSGGSPSSGDPASLDTVTHSFAGSYSKAPIVVPINKCDWHIYISSVSTSQVVVGVGAYGSGTTLDYDLLVIEDQT